MKHETARFIGINPNLPISFGNQYDIAIETHDEYISVTVELPENALGTIRYYQLNYAGMKELLLQWDFSN